MLKNIVYRAVLAPPAQTAQSAAFAVLTEKSLPIKMRNELLCP